MFLSPQDFDAYLRPITSEQAEIVSFLRGLIVESGLELDEHVETGKWYTGLLVYNAPGGITTYALGPLSGGFTTFHTMAFYGSAKLQERHGEVLKPLLTGKSCMKMRRLDQLPIEAIRDIIASGPAYVETARKMLEARKKKKLIL